MIPLLIIGCIVFAILAAFLWFLPNTETSNNIQKIFSNSLLFVLFSINDKRYILQVIATSEEIKAIGTQEDINNLGKET